MENPFKPKALERLEEGDYSQFLVELSYSHFVRSSKLHPEIIAHTLNLLNRSYDLFGEGKITAEKGIEVIELPPELQAENPLIRETRKVYEIEKFTHEGHGLGFQYNATTREFVLSFTDTENPFDVSFGQFQDDPLVVREPVRTIHVPVAVPHSVTMLNGYHLEHDRAA